MCVSKHFRLKLDVNFIGSVVFFFCLFSFSCLFDHAVWLLGVVWLLCRRLLIFLFGYFLRRCPLFFVVAVFSRPPITLPSMRAFVV